mmetsp:Transcript_38507/g.86478  ORF Transcript_38507/g.86478 Transcript_38507/m.86478 type:complete len:251 (-) Transcript_38507:2195-2947(-)
MGSKCEFIAEPIVAPGEEFESESIIRLISRGRHHPTLREGDHVPEIRFQQPGEQVLGGPIRVGPEVNQPVVDPTIVVSILIRINERVHVNVRSARHRPRAASSDKRIAKRPQTHGPGRVAVPGAHPVRVRARRRRVHRPLPQIPVRVALPGEKKARGHGVLRHQVVRPGGAVLIRPAVHQGESDVVGPGLDGLGELDHDEAVGGHVGLPVVGPGLEDRGLGGPVGGGHGESPGGTGVQLSHLPALVRRVS